MSDKKKLPIIVKPVQPQKPRVKIQRGAPPSGKPAATPPQPPGK